jgi:hypothetical protein
MDEILAGATFTDTPEAEVDIRTARFEMNEYTG